MPKRPTFNDFKDKPVSVPDFVHGAFGMDITVRGDMDDNEWKRWVAITNVPELRGMMGKYRKAKGVNGLRDAIVAFLTENNIEVFDA
jgi:hypothetical protein